MYYFYFVYAKIITFYYFCMSWIKLVWARILRGRKFLNFIVDPCAGDMKKSKLRNSVNVVLRNRSNYFWNLACAEASRWYCRPASTRLSEQHNINRGRGQNSNTGLLANLLRDGISARRLCLTKWTVFACNALQVDLSKPCLMKSSLH